MLSSTMELLERCTGKKVIPTIGKGEKLVQGADGEVRVEPDGERFAKAAVTPAEKSDLAKSMAKSILRNRRVFTVGGSAQLTKALRKRAEAIAAEAQRQGLAPTIGATGPNEAGYSDADIRELENAIAEVGLTPAAAAKLLASILAIPRNETRRMPAVDGAGYTNSAKLRSLVKAAVDSSVARMNETLKGTTLARIDPTDPEAFKKSLIKTLQTGRRSIFDPRFTERWASERRPHRGVTDMGTFTLQPPSGVTLATTYQGKSGATYAPNGAGQLSSAMKLTHAALSIAAGQS